MTVSKMLIIAAAVFGVAVVLAGFGAWDATQNWQPVWVFAGASFACGWASQIPTKG